MLRCQPTHHFKCLIEEIKKTHKSWHEKSLSGASIYANRQTMSAHRLSTFEPISQISRSQNFKSWKVSHSPRIKNFQKHIHRWVYDGIFIVTQIKFKSLKRKWSNQLENPCNWASKNTIASLFGLVLSRKIAKRVLRWVCESFELCWDFGVVGKKATQSYSLGFDDEVCLLFHIRRIFVKQQMNQLSIMSVYPFFEP